MAEGDPAYVDAGDFYADGKPRSESRRREEQRLAREQRHRRQEIRGTLSEEARPLIPYADVTFFD